MKKISVILFLLLFLLQCSIKTIIVAAFYAHRDYISKNLCENKNKPEMHCKGKCYLNKQLKKEQQHENEMPGILKTIDETYINNAATDFLFSTIETIVAPSFKYLMNAYPKNTDDVFHPPASLS